MNTSHLWIGIVGCVVLLVAALGITRGRLDKVGWLLVVVGCVAILFVVLDWNAFLLLPGPAEAAPAHVTPVIHHLHSKH